MSNDDAKKIILARRAKFIAAAVASFGIACNNENTPPQPCLSVAPYSPDAESPVPQPCLSPVAVDAGTIDVPDAEPMPCLSIRVDPPDAAAPPRPPTKDAGAIPPPLPHPCLSPKRPTQPQ